MISCPSCHKQVEVTEQNHGTLFTCPHCSAVYFVGWDGQFEMPVEHAADQPLETTQIAESPAFVPPISDFSSEPTTYHSEYQPTDDLNENPAAQTYESEVEPAMEESFTAGESFVAEEIPAQDAYTSTEPTEAEPSPYDFSKGLGDQVTAATPDTADFSDVESFANSDAGSNALLYTVTIEGIDSHALVKQLKEALSDSKFNWDADALIDQVGGGRLVLKRIGATKASVLIQRIKYLPLKISWRQDVFAGS